MKKLAIVVMIAICLAGPLNGAIKLDEKGLPEGSWQKTCQNPRYDKNTRRLTAECKTSYQNFKKATESNQYTKSTLVLDDLDDIKDIKNYNGWLVAELHEGGKHVLPAGDYKSRCKDCKVFMTNDAIGNKVYCVSCECTVKDSQGKMVQETQLVCHSDLLNLDHPIEVENGAIALNAKYLPAGEYLRSCKECKIDLEFRRADAKAENGLQLNCMCPSTTGKYYKTYIRINDIREFMENPKPISNTAGILTQD